LDEPDPSRCTAILAGLFAPSDPLSVTPIVSSVAAWLLAMLAATYRVALEEASRTRLLDEVRDARQRARLERRLNREDAIDVTLALVQFAAELWFILALAAALPHDPEGFLSGLGAPGSTTRNLWILGLCLLWLFPTVHALPRGIIAYGHAETLLRPSLGFLSLLATLLSPVTVPFLRLRGRAGRLFRTEPEEEKEHLTDGIIDAVEEGERAGALEESEAQMIERVLAVQELQVSEIMTPRTDLTSISIEASVAEACELAHREGHSKIPVYKDNRDDIVGVFHLRDAIPPLLDPGAEPPTLASLVRNAYFVPETKKVLQLLREFQAQQQLLAIVLDEYGGTEGVISVEDILEEIVGELREEHDVEETHPIKHLGEDLVSIDPRLRIEEANEELEIHLPESEDYDTVGGFVFSHLDRIPDSGEVFVFDGVEFRVVEVDNRRITRLQLRPLNHR
jgi:magnesium and cobalt transporter